MTIKAIFLRHSRIDSLLIRAASWSSWSHVALIMEDGVTVIDAAFLRGGVTEHPLIDLTATASKYAIREFSCPDPAAAYAFARSQKGKPYDWTGVLGLGLHRDWQQDDAWWCSELVEECLAAGGNKRFIEQVRRVTQQHSWMVA